MSSLLEKVYQVFDPEPTKLDKLYVELDDVRGSVGVVQELADRMRLSSKPTCQILAGHRGSGKTTELRRLQRDLEKGDPRHFVVFCTSDDDIDRNDVDFPDVLVAVVRQMASDLRERAKIDLAPGYFREICIRFKDFLGSEIDVEEFGLETGLLNLSGTIKNSPDARSKIRKLLEPDTDNLLKAANDVIQ